MRLFTHFGRRACAVLWVCMAGWAQAQGVSDKDIVLGMTLSLQGGKNSYGAAAAQGMALYFDQVNNAGGVNGRRIVTRVLDDDNQADKAVANARQLVQDGAFILFSAIDGGPSTAVMKAANDLGVPFFGPLAGSPTLRRPHQRLVFPVRAEHMDEFRALMVWGKSTGLSTLGFLHTDSEVGQQHLANVKLLAQELGMQVAVAIPFKGEITDAQLDQWVQAIGKSAPGMFINHGGAGVYQRLVARAKGAGLKTSFMGVNSGSSQIVKALGPLAQGMVFAQVVPNPWVRKSPIAREYQDAVRAASPQADFSYGALEGYMTAKAMVMALRGAGRNLTRATLLTSLERGEFDLGGIKLTYRTGDHAGSRYVDLSMVSREGRFVH